MRGAALFLAITAMASAQVLVHSPAFPWPSGSESLRCEVTPIRPTLNFGLRMQAGYTLQVPMNQYQGAGHRWRVLVRIRPDGHEADAAYFISRFNLPPVPETKELGEIGGGFLLGNGHYSVTLALTDDLGRLCRHEWQVDALFERSARGLRNALAPNAITELSWVRAPANRAPVLDRMTIMLQAAPRLPRASTLEASDLEQWLGELGSLREQVPARKERLVVFNLEQQKVLFEADDFHLSDLNRVAEAIYNLQLNTVDFHILQKTGGDVDLLAGIVNRELSSTEPSEAVVFMGPYRPSRNRVSRTALAEPLPRLKNAPQRFYYVQYWAIPRIRAPIGPAMEPFQRRGGGSRGGGMDPAPFNLGGGAAGNDIIRSLMGMLKGKTLVVNSPGDFAKAVRRIAARK
jgi:hypothetical protein